MKTTIYTEKDFKVGTWKGGSTTELYIFPQTANYKDLNFEIRISSAKVELPESIFTPLPNVNRQLMILDGQIKITHKDHYSKILSPFDVDTFQGDWQTTSEGICTDFNVMTMGNRKSELWAAELTENQKENITVCPNENEKFFVYLFSGQLSVHIKDKSYALTANTLLAIEDISVNDFFYGSKKLDVKQTMSEIDC